MKLKFVYPGSFCPPTYGHYQILQKAAQLFDHLTIVCSRNPKKTSNWFTPDERAQLWREGYQLPDNVDVMTIDEIRKGQLDMSKLVIVRGVRNESHFEEEKQVIFLNQAELGIDKFFYLVSDEDYRHISSSKARKAAEDLDFRKLADLVSPMVVSALLERSLHLKSINMVVGRPGSGKSTFFRMLNQLNPDQVHVNTDEFTEELKPLLQQEFGDVDLVKLALQDEELVKSVLAEPWLDKLRQRLKEVRPNTNLYLEIPYGMQPDKELYQMVGGRVIYYQVGDGTNEQVVCAARLANRGTPNLIPFIQRIPDRRQAEEIAKQQLLKLKVIEAPEDLGELNKTVAEFNEATK